MTSIAGEVLMRVQTKRSSSIAHDAINKYGSWQAAREAMYKAEENTTPTKVIKTGNKSLIDRILNFRTLKKENELSE
jgi:hypothetical protein